MKNIKEKAEKVVKKLKFNFPYSVDEWIEKDMPMENYHKHTDFSNNAVPDSAENMENYAKRTVKYNGRCLFSGEHGSQGNAIPTYKLAEQYGLLYRHSAEAYWVKDRHEKDRSNCHMIVVAKNQQGLGDLNYILSMANIDGYYYQPRIDLDLLLSVNPENFIVTSSCLAGHRYDDSDEIWLKIANHFGNNFFIEIQNHNTEKQKVLNKHLVELAKQHDLQLICGLDSHFCEDENEEKRLQVLKFKHVEYNSDEDGWYMDYPDTKEVIRRLEEQGVLNDEEILESIMNTLFFIDECSPIEFNKQFKIPNIYKGASYNERVRKLMRILNKAYKGDPIKSKEKKEGIQWELKQFAESNTVDYPLVSSAIVDKAVNDYGGVITTTSRGSMASFCINKMIGLTTMDRFNSDVPLFPERFLTKDRILAGSMPDCDLNCKTQEPFVKASRELLGEHGCYPLMTLSKMKEKAAWQLYASVNGVTPRDSLAISKALDRYNDKMKYADEEDKRYIKVEDYIPEDYIELYKRSLVYQSITLKLGVHACGHLIFDGDIRREFGLVSAKNETAGKRTLVAAVEGQYLDEFGYVKEDFLIVDVVGIIKELFDSINQPIPTFEELKDLVKTDNKTWKIYEKGATCCVNQCEKASTTQKVMRYKPRSIAELCAFVAMIRPGAKSLLGSFLDRRPYSTGEPMIDELLKDSSHYMCYQESIMKVLSFLGIPMPETYTIIKSISKKKLKGKKKDDLLVEMKAGWMERFGNLNNFNKVWQVIEDAAAYGFNASHAYAMAGDSLYCAYFKAHYPAKFYETAITHYQKKSNKDKISALVNEAKRFFGFVKMPFKFRQDGRSVNIVGKEIHLNLSSIKGFGENVAEALYEIAKEPYSSFYELLKVLDASPINNTQIKNLIKINYFSEFGNTVKLLEIKRVYDLAGKAKKISFKKIKENNLEEDLIEKYGKKCKSEFTQFNREGFMMEFENNYKGAEPDPYTVVRDEIDVIGVPQSVFEDMRDDLAVVLSIELKGKVGKVDIYYLKDGVVRTLKFWGSIYEKNPFDTKDIISVSKVESKRQTRRTDKINEKTGKYIYEEVRGTSEFWLGGYYIKNHVKQV